MAFENGNKFGNGRPKGSENKSTKLTKELLQSVLDANSNKLMVELEKLEGRAFFDVYLRITDFVLPKQTRVTERIEDNNSEKFDLMLEILSENVS